MFNISKKLTSRSVINTLRCKNLPFILSVTLACCLYLRKIHELLFKVELASQLPLLNIDLSSYYLWILRGVTALEKNGQLLGYDPYMGAGRIISPSLGIGCFLLTKICYYLKPLFSVEQSLLYLEISLIILPPLLLIPVCKTLRSDSKIYLPALMLIATVYGFHLPLTPGIQNGALLTFEASCFISIYVVTLICRWVKSTSKKDYLLFTILLPLVIQLHIASIITLFFPLFLITLNLIWNKKLGQLLYLSLTYSFCLLVNYNLLALWIETRGWYTGADYLGSNYLVVWNELFGITGVDLFSILSSVIRCSLVLFSAAYLSANLKKSFCNKKLLFYWLIYLIVIVSFADNFLGGNKIQAARYMLPAWIIVLVFATAELSHKSNRPLKLTFYSLLILSGFICKYSTKNTELSNSAKVTPYSKYYTLTNEKVFFNILTPEEQRLVSFISHDLPKNGRLLMETADKFTFHLVSLINATSNVSQIGEEAKSSHTINNFQIFYRGDDLIAFQEIPYLPNSNFEQYLNLYNITHIATTDLVTKGLISPFLDPKGLFVSNIYSIFKTKIEPTWFMTGKGDVEYAINQIKLHHLSAGEIITKFHYIKGLVTEPNVKINPIYILKDPVPFISFNNVDALSEIKIYFPRN